MLAKTTDERLKNNAYEIFGKKPGITLLARMVHARRKFDEAKNNDKERAEGALKKIQKVYKTERKARDEQLTFEQRK